MSSKILSTKKTKFFWVHFIVSVIALALGAILMPIYPDKVFFHDWGTKIVSAIIAGGLIAYLALFLWKKFKAPQKQVMQVLTILEFALLAIIAIFAILSIFNIGGTIFGPSKTFGIALWLRGVVEIFRAYYHQSDDKEKYPVYLVCLSIAFVTIGAFLFFSNLIQEKHIIWTFVALLYLAGLFFLSMGFVTKPAKKKVEKTEDKKVEDKKVEDKKVEDKKEHKKEETVSSKEEKKAKKAEEKAIKKENKEVEKAEKK